MHDRQRDTAGQHVRCGGAADRTGGTLPGVLGNWSHGESSVASVKVRAAEAIFNHAAKAIEIEDIEARVSELERAAEQVKSPRR